MSEAKTPQTSATLLNSEAVCLVIKATLKPVGDTDRFQPAGFPEVGHVIYDAPRSNRTKEKVCIVDSPASMANHLETVCAAATGSLDLHGDLTNLPFVLCETDDRDSHTASSDKAESKKKDTTPPRIGVCSTFTEGHRLASDYFLDSTTTAGKGFRQALRDDFKIVEVKKDKTYFIPPEKWWDIFKTVFKYDPNSLVHGVMFAKEQIKISRLLTAHLEAFGAGRVGRSGVKFDRLQKTTSGQPIFSVDEETAQEIRATFIIDLGLLRSYGRDDKGLNDAQKKLLLDLALWKIKQLVARPFRYRTQCFLGCCGITIETEMGELDRAPAKPASKPEGETSGATNDEQESSVVLLKELPSLLKSLGITQSIKDCGFKSDNTTRVYYPAAELFKAGKDEKDGDDDKSDEETTEDEA